MLCGTPFDRVCVEVIGEPPKNSLVFLPSIQHCQSLESPQLNQIIFTNGCSKEYKVSTQAGRQKPVFLVPPQPKSPLVNI